MRLYSVLVAWLLVVPVAVTQGDVGQVDARIRLASADDDSPAVVDTIALPGRQLLALALYEAGNRIFVTDDVSGDILVIDGTTRQVISSIAVGRSAYEIVIDESFGKVYVASNGGFADGTGLISVIDADTGQLLTQFDPGALNEVSPSPGKADAFRLEGDEVHDKVYVSLFCPFCDELAVIDVASDTYTPVEANVHFGFAEGVMGVNTVANDAFAVGTDLDKPSSGSPQSWLIRIDGETLQVSSTLLPETGFAEMAVNEIDDKVYVFMGPLGGWSGLIIHHRPSGTFKTIEHPNREGTSPLVFNQATDRLFSGATVNGKRGIIVEGATDELSYVKLRGNGMNAGGVRSSTDNAYFAAINGRTFIVNGATHRIGVLPRTTGSADTDGDVASAVAIDEARGLIYVIHDDEAPRITIIQDGVLPPAPETTISGGPSRKTTRRTVTFRFGSDQPNSTFRCKLDDRQWRKCTSPKRYRRLSLSHHVFRVKARNSLSMVDPTPARRAFRVVP
jgi:YVTN family beta-propeller protein